MVKFFYLTIVGISIASMTYQLKNDGKVEAWSKKGVAVSPDDTHCSDITGVGAAWWYNWHPTNPSNCPGEFIPMIWGKRDIPVPELPGGSDWLLGFNEPNSSN